jgi:aldehyde dehydrogenase (NAD+)
MLEDKRIPLISATGSTRVGMRVAQKVGERLGRSILELGGNNAIIISENANLDLAIRAVTFGAVGRPDNAAPLRAASSSTKKFMRR